MIVTEIGNPEMNSYVSSTEAEDYFAQRIHAETWEDIDNDESFLITATNNIDWYLSFPGIKTSTTQPLEWPREGVFDTKNQSSIDSNIIPVKIKYAVLEFALSSIQADRTIDSDMAGLQEVQIGTLKVKSNSSGSWQETKTVIPEIIYKILDGIIVSAGAGTMFKTVIRS
jgi:hypothetical protein